MTLWILNIFGFFAAKPKLTAGLIVFLLLIGGGWYFANRLNKAETDAANQKQENEHLQRRNEGLGILVNTANIAKEIEDEKKIANSQQDNSANANAVYANTRRRDSNQSSGNFADARRNFCAEFPDDSLCAGAGQP
jgi:cbb3-type cytochrome oxidase subunit 3